MADNTEDPTPNATGLNPLITDSVTQSSVHTLALGPAIASVNAYLGQAQALTILFSNAVNQQANLATIAAAATSEQLGELLKVGE